MFIPLYDKQKLKKIMSVAFCVAMKNGDLMYAS